MSCREWPGSQRSRFTSGSPSACSGSTSVLSSLISSAKDTDQDRERSHQELPEPAELPLPQPAQPEPAELPAPREVPLSSSVGDSDVRSPN